MTKIKRNQNWFWGFYVWSISITLRVGLPILGVMGIIWSINIWFSNPNDPGFIKSLNGRSQEDQALRTMILGVAFIGIWLIYIKFISPAYEYLKRKLDRLRGKDET